MFRTVRTSLCSRHSITLAAVERDVELQRFGLDRALPELVKDAVRIEGAIVIANASVIAPDNEMRATKVLADECMKQRLAGARIAHLDRIACLYDRSAPEIVLDHRTNCPGANIGWNV